MKRLLLLFTFFSVPIILLCQQDKFRNWRVGTTTSLNINTKSLPNNLEETKGLTMDIEAAHRFTNRLELELGIGFTKFSRLFGCPPTFPCFTIRSHMDLKYLDISIMGNYYFTQKDRLNIFATTGFEYQRLINPLHFDPLIVTPIHNKTVINPVIGAGVEFRIFKQFIIRYTSKYIKGISKLINDNDSSKRSYLSLNLGLAYRF